MQQRPRLRHCNHIWTSANLKFSMRAKQKVRANFKTRRFERKIWVYIAAHDLRIPTWIMLPIVSALIKCKDDALQARRCARTTEPIYRGVCLLRQAAQYLLSKDYRLAVDRCEARTGRGSEGFCSCPTADGLSSHQSVDRRLSHQRHFARKASSLLPAGAPPSSGCMESVHS